MSESIDYAEMLEIPVNTLNVVKKKGRKKKDDDLKSRAVREVNERMEEEARRADADALANGAGAGENGAASPEAEERVAGSEDVTDYVSDAEEKPKKKFFDSRVLIAEFAAVCALVALILLTNIFMPNSAINTFFAGLTGTEEAVYEDDRSYAELTLGAVAPDGIECSVADGVLTFTGECSVYAPYGGTVQSVAENGRRLYDRKSSTRPHSPPSSRGFPPHTGRRAIPCMPRSPRVQRRFRGGQRPPVRRRIAHQFVFGERGKRYCLERVSVFSEN